MTERERLGPPPVEPMPDIAWSRVERGLWSRLDAGEAGASPASTERRPGAAARWWIIAAPLAAAAILAVVVGLRLLLPAPGEEPVRIVSPKVAASEKLESSSVTFEDSHIELDADTALVTSHEGGHPHVLLERGAAWFTVSPRKSRPEFVVRAGDAMVRVIGTRFRVARAGEQIAVEVGHGVVDVLFRGRVVAVATGQRWSSESPASASVLAALPPTPAPVAVGQPEPEIDPVDPPPAHKPEPKRTTRPTARTGGAVAAPEPAPGSASAESVDRERAEYERLAALEPKSPDKALNGYLALSKGTSRWAGVAMFAAGRLAADRHHPDAEVLLDKYLKSYPKGANAVDAQRLLSRIKADRARGE
jgi:hypothetical protein